MKTIITGGAGFIGCNAASRHFAAAIMSSSSTIWRGKASKGIWIGYKVAGFAGVCSVGHPSRRRTGQAIS